MATPPDSSFAELRRTLREAALLSSANGVLGWDERTYLPPAAGALRAEQSALLARLAHERLTSPRVGELLAELADRFDAESDEAIILRETRRDYARATQLPSSLVEELHRVGTLSEQAWVGARRANDFAAFAPWLDRVLNLKRQEAACLGRGEGDYDVLLDDYEPGATADDLATLFAELRPALVEIVGQSAGRTSPALPDVPVNAAHQKALCERVITRIGYDLSAGRLDETTHPFATGIGPGDTRITTRYRENDLTDALFGTLHEAGHALYEQGLPKSEHFGTPLAESVSLGIHESQSRLWENFVGRSEAFWAYLLPIVRHVVGHRAWHRVTPADASAAVRRVQPSLIRVEADEVTYNLHVMIRFDLERALLSGDLAVRDLPNAWAAAYREALGVEPPDDTRGCLQDVHWSYGAIGYFPTYTLGNVYAAELYDAASADLGDLPSMFAAGEFSPLLGWLRDKVHRHGRRYAPRELVRRATNRAPTAGALVSHLRRASGV